MATGGAKLAAGALLLAAAGAGAYALTNNKGGGKTEGVAAPAAFDGTITISPVVPNSLNDTTLAGAASFAWNEFIALNWPAVPQTGQPNTRDVADTGARFGDPSYVGPLVWHTFRSKIEIFPPNGSQPNGYNTNAGASYGYDAPPQYTYATSYQPASGTPSTSTPWINLDENDEIGLDAMYAGVASELGYTQGLILFAAKANRAEYNYVAANQFFDPSIAKPAKAASSAYVLQNQSSPPAGSPTMASLPTGTIEIKTAWRALTPTEAGSGKFYQNTVRYYRPGNGDTTYVDTTFGMVALHIIQKTPGQPFFVFATFEQADNLLTSTGQPVEDADGNLNPGMDTISSPTEPVIMGTPASNPAPNGYTTGNIQSLSPDTSLAVPGSRLFYINSEGPETQGAVAVNKRAHGIPQTIISANQAAHAAMTAYASQNNLPAAVWQHYKLVNVQAAPIDKPTPGADYTGADSATYYQANIVVETDYNLQKFSGQFQPGFIVSISGSDTTKANVNNLITDWCGSNVTATGCPTDTMTVNGVLDTVTINGPFHNVYYNGKGYNMGGCMGCHGNAQVAGADFSFILKEGNNASAQTADPVSAPQDVAKYIQFFEAVRASRASPAAAGGAAGAPPARAAPGATGTTSRADTAPRTGGPP
ncbi:MAG TPA: hypothetical protein VNP72_11595 [Longimicrobium sp.]|nr:hypothetical protein [Longimicrobium sp.]